MRSNLQVEESRLLAIRKRERSKANKNATMVREKALVLHVREEKVNAEAHAVYLLVVENDLLCKTLGLALSRAEEGVTKQEAKVLALAAFEKQKWMTEADNITRIFQDMPPSPVPSPVMACDTPVRAGPDSTASASTLCSLPAQAFPAKVLFPALDPAAPVRTAVPWLSCPPVPTPVAPTCTTTSLQTAPEAAPAPTPPAPLTLPAMALAPAPAHAPTAAPTCNTTSPQTPEAGTYNTTSAPTHSTTSSLQTPEAEAAVTAMRSSLQVDESRNLALRKRERSEATLHLKMAREKALMLHVRQVKVNADAHTLHLLVVESDMQCKTLGLALSQAEKGVTKQQAKVVALAAYERQNRLARRTSSLAFFRICHHHPCLLR